MSRDSTVRVLKFKIIGADGDFLALKSRLKEVSLSIQRVVNDFWSLWLAAHIKRGSPAKIREWMPADIAWAKAPKKDKGPRVKCPVQPIDKSVSNEIYHALRKYHPSIHTRPVVLAMNIQSGKLCKTKASKSAYPRWMRILAGEGEFPSSSSPLPIPFDKANSRPIPPMKDGDGWKLQISLDAMKDGKRAAAYILNLKTGGKELRQHRDALLKIAAGEWKWSGSNLVLIDGVWYAHLCYQLPKAERANLDPDKIAYLNPAADKPIHLWVNEYPLWLRRTGKDVWHVRGQLSTRYQSNDQAYKFASSARKGHGQKRANAWREKLSRRWRDFVKTYNERLAWDVTERLVREGIGTLVFYQPVGSRRDTRFLATAGAQGRNDPRGRWDWTQLAGLLARKSEEKGIAFEIRRCGDEGFSAKKRTQPKDGNGVAAERLEAVLV